MSSLCAIIPALPFSSAASMTDDPPSMLAVKPSKALPIPSSGAASTANLTNAPPSATVPAAAAPTPTAAILPRLLRDPPTPFSVPEALSVADMMISTVFFATLPQRPRFHAWACNQSNQRR